MQPAGSKRKSVEKLAAALLRDRERPAPTNNSIIECFACGRSHMRRPVSGDDNPRFCSRRCQDAFDAGFPPYDPNHDRRLSNVPLSGWLLNGARHYEIVLRGTKAWRRLAKSAEWAPVHKLKIRPKKPSKITSLQGDFSGLTNLPIRSDWKPSNNVDPAGVPEIPSFLDRRPRADAPDESIEQVRKAA
jgi:hypothetical protein